MLRRLSPTPARSNDSATRQDAPRPHPVGAQAPAPVWQDLASRLTQQLQVGLDRSGGTGRSVPTSAATRATAQHPHNDTAPTPGAAR